MDGRPYRAALAALIDRGADTLATMCREWLAAPSFDEPRYA